MSVESSTVAYPPKKPHLIALDGLRGVAAFSVVLLHWFEGNGYGLFHYSLMAVDFFFLLSGFVIAYSYEDRLRDGLPLRTFFASRVVRLYPMIFLGILLGLMREIMKRLTEGRHHDMSDLIGTTVVNLFMLPTLDSHINIVMFPLNIALWSLFFEFVAYILYATLYARTGKWVLALTILTAIPGIMGWIYIAFDKMPGIFAVPFFESTLTQNLSRLLFAYFLGVWLYRNQGRLAFVPGLSFAILAALSALLFAMPVHALPSGINVLIMAVVLPLIVLSASRTRLGPRTKAVAAFIGNLSYPLYVVHTPLIWTLNAIFKKVMPDVFVMGGNYCTGGTDLFLSVPQVL